ncbi:hypothetical protein LTR05_000461 [Lithohypha guttulata]|uniref:AB hydrolase-1 domain-containing protein n=1 Tax=Lithohypha guttulata TaxID=1690604 RepID=A0AAN7T646_9EURO|nr:hypothetical protein LTR05_000461 [Lithohypha guttulata]
MSSNWLRHCFLGLALSGGVYVAALIALTIPIVQKNATYAHNVNPALWQNVSNVEQFGFIHHQVQPFTIKSTDNVTLYAWHILPTHLYREHKDALTQQSDFGVKPFEKAADTVGFRLLLENPNSKAIVSFHGNAAHLGSSYRPATYQQLLSTSTPEHPVHVVAFDYRGFGTSTGTPSERGVIDDGIAVVSALCGKPPTFAQLNRHSEGSPSAPALDPSQIILVGQSLGTFVSTATLYRWTIELQQASLRALILLASFSSLPKLLDSYSIKGFTPPILSPLTPYPFMQTWFRKRIVDKWDLASRLQEMIMLKDLKLDVTMMHAKDDWEIPYREGYTNWLAVEEAVNSTGTFTKTHDDLAHPEFSRTWTSDDGAKRVRWDKVRHGGHNRIPTSEHLKVVLYDILERAQ